MSNSENKSILMNGENVKKNCFDKIKVHDLRLIFDEIESMDCLYKGIKSHGFCKYRNL